MKSFATKATVVKAGIISGASAILFLLAYEVAHGTPLRFAFGIFIALLIPLCFFAIERPLIFPFGLFVVLAPFESILNVGHVGTINKLIGIATFGAITLSMIRRGQLVKPSPAMLTWLGLLVWMGISAFWSIDIQNWQDNYFTVAQNFILYGAVALTIATPADIEILSTCAVVGGLAASAVALWPLVTGGTLLRAGARISLPANNVHHHSDPNIFAASLLLPYAILFSSTLASRRLTSLAGNLAGLGLVTITIVLSGSRAAMLATLALTIYIMLANRRRRLFALGLLIIACAAVLPFGFDIASRWSNAISSGGAGRTDIWTVALLAFKSHWLFGWGYGSFESAYDKFVLQAPLNYYVNWHRAPHDILIETGVDLGIVGILMVGFAFFMQFRDLFLPATGFLDDLRIALQATVLGICVDALFLDFMDRKFLWVLFMMIALVRSTIINKRRTACATPSSLMHDRASPKTRSIESSSH